MGRGSATKAVVQSAGNFLLGELISWIESSALGHGEQRSEKKPTSLGEPQSFEQLNQDCVSRAYSHFLAQFGYPYDGAKSVPPLCIDSNTIHASEDFFSAQANNTERIAGTVDASLDATTAPWAYDRMRSDITARVTAIAEGAPTNSFIMQGISLDYANPNDLGRTFQADICWVYCTTQAPDPVRPDHNVVTTFLYSIGVSYIAPGWGHRQTTAPRAFPVVRLSFAFTTAIIGTAIASFIYTARNKPTNIYVTMDALALRGSITISTKDKTSIDPDTGEPEIPYQWAIEALNHVGVEAVQTDVGTATASEAAEFELLREWDATKS